METGSSPSRTSFEHERPGQLSELTNQPLSHPGRVPFQAAFSASQSETRIGAAERDIAAFSPAQGCKPMSPQRPTLPPPPKVGEKAMPPEYYAPRQAGLVQGRHRHASSLQMPPVYPRLESVGGQADVWNTPTGRANERIPARSRAKSLAEGTTGGNMEHPPGYMQNPYASDMTPEQRFATAQEEDTDEGLPMPNCTQSRRPSTASASLEDSIDTLWRRARKNTGGFIDGVQEWLSNPF